MFVPADRDGFGSAFLAFLPDLPRLYQKQPKADLRPLLLLQHRFPSIASPEIVEGINSFLSSLLLGTLYDFMRLSLALCRTMWGSEAGQTATP